MQAVIEDGLQKRGLEKGKAWESVKLRGAFFKQPSQDLPRELGGTPSMPTRTDGLIARIFTNDISSHSRLIRAFSDMSDEFGLRNLVLTLERPSNAEEESSASFEPSVITPQANRFEQGSLTLGEALGGASEAETLGKESRALELLSQARAVPKDMYPDRRTFEKLGFEFKDLTQVEGIICMTCTLPEGWSYSRGDEPRDVYLRDEHGKKRTHIFFKTSAHDPKGSMSLLPSDFVD